MKTKKKIICTHTIHPHTYLHTHTYTYIYIYTYTNEHSRGTESYLYSFHIFRFNYCLLTSLLFSFCSYLPVLFLNYLQLFLILLPLLSHFIHLNLHIYIHNRSIYYIHYPLSRWCLFHLVGYHLRCLYYFNFMECKDAQSRNAVFVA